MVFCFVLGMVYILYHLERRWRNSHVLLYLSPLLSDRLGVAPSTFTTVYLYITSIYLHGDLGSPHRSLPFLHPACQGTNAYKHCAECDLDFCSTCCMSECPMPLGLNNSFWEKCGLGMVKQRVGIVVVCMCIWNSSLCDKTSYVFSCKMCFYTWLLLYWFALRKATSMCPSKLVTLKNLGPQWCDASRGTLLSTLAFLLQQCTLHVECLT